MVQAKDILVNLAIIMAIDPIAIMAIDPIAIVDAEETVMSVMTETSTSIYRPQLSDKVCFPSEEKVKLSVNSRSLNNVFIPPNSDEYVCVKDSGPSSLPRRTEEDERGRTFTMLAWPSNKM